jgi:NDP-sugar pyrophosphorylase family protein
MRELENNGITKVTLLLGRGAEDVRRHAEEGSYGITINCVVDCERGLGTGAALAQALPQIPPDFFLTYGDTLLDASYLALFNARARIGATCAMVVSEPHSSAEQTNCLYQGGYVRGYAKVRGGFGNTIDFGLLLLSKSALEPLMSSADSPHDLGQTIGALCNLGQMAGYYTSSRYWEAGNPEALERVRREFSARDYLEQSRL